MESGNSSTAADSGPAGVSNVGLVVRSKMGRYASPADWDDYRETITRMYLYEEKTLKEVKAYMEETYQFFAT